MTAYTLSEAAKRTGRSRSTIRRRHEAHTFPGAFLERGEWRIPEADLEAAGLIPSTAYQVTTLAPWLAQVAQNEPAQRSEVTQVSEVEVDLRAQLDTLRGQLVEERTGRLVAEAVAHERGLALERQDRAMRGIEAPPARSWWTGFAKAVRS